MARSAEEILAHHLHALVADDLDDLIADYADDAVLVTAAGVARGKEAIRAAFAAFSGALAGAVFDVKTQIVEGDVVLLEWVLDSPAAHVDGADTFVCGDDKIRVQTISQLVQPKP